MAKQIDAKKGTPLTFKSAGSAVIGFVSASVTPMIPGLVAGGMLKVVLLLITQPVWADFADTTSYTLLSGVAGRHSSSCPSTSLTEQRKRSAPHLSTR